MSVTTQLDDARAMNNQFFEWLQTPGLEKKAYDAVNDFTRTKMREDGYLRKIIPLAMVTNDDLDRQADTDKPVIVVDKEPDSPAAITIPFGALPISLYIRAPRYRVHFQRLATPRFVKDVSELRTWKMDIRQVLSDNSIKDLLAKEDTQLQSAVTTLLVGQNVVQPNSGVVQWEAIPGGISRQTLEDSFKIMPSTNSHLEVNTVLINNVTIREVMKFGRDEMGGDMSQEVFKNGWTDVEFMRAKWIITIKRNIVPDDTMFHWADPKFIGKFFGLEDTTLYVKREAYMLEFFSYEELGGSIGNVTGITRADFV
jgi:hypothetical protein